MIIAMQNIANAHTSNMFIKLLLWVDSHFVVLLAVGAVLFILYLLSGMTGNKRSR